jgi:hypothetical protein
MKNEHHIITHKDVKFNTLVYGCSNEELIAQLNENKIFDIKFLIHSQKNFYKDLDHQELIKYNINKKFESKISEEAQKNYQEFYNSNFNTFAFQFIRRGLKTLDIHEIRNHFAYFYYNFFNIVKEKKIELMIFFSFPHLGADFILYKIAKMLNLKTILLYQTIFPNKYLIYQDISKLGRIEKVKVKENKFNIQELKEFIRKYIVNYQSLQKRTFKERKALFKRNTLKNVIIRILIKLRLIFREDQAFLEKKYLYNLEKKQINVSDIDEICKNKKIIFFALHMQPELTTSLLGENYEDQILALEKLSLFAKDEWAIIVKDHPAQTSYQRNDFFFKRLNLLKNVYFIDRKSDTEIMIKRSNLVATITGTIGFEALYFSKKCLIFGNCWYQNFAGIFRVKDKTTGEEINEFINTNIESHKFLRDFNSFLSTCENGVVDSYYKSEVKNFNNEENCKDIINSLSKFITNYQK